MSTIDLLSTVTGVLLLGASAFLLWNGRQHYRYATAISEAVPFDAAASLRDLVVVDGVVEGPLDGATLESGMSGTPCVAYSARRTTKMASGNEDVRRAPSGLIRERIKERSDSIPFLLETADGRVRVDASDALVEVHDDAYTPVSMGDVRQNRGALVGLYWLVRSILTDADRQYQREYEEVCFEAGDEISAIGSLDVRGEATGERTLRQEDGTSLVVTSQSHSDVAETFRSIAKTRLIWGVIFLVIGGALLAIQTGIL